MINLIRNIKKQAAKREIGGKGYNYVKRKVLWINKECPWNHLMVCFGIPRRGVDKKQLMFYVSTNNCNYEYHINFKEWSLYFIYSRRFSRTQINKLKQILANKTKT